MYICLLPSFFLLSYVSSEIISPTPGLEGNIR